MKLVFINLSLSKSSILASSNSLKTSINNLRTLTLTGSFSFDFLIFEYLPLSAVLYALQNSVKRDMITYIFSSVELGNGVPKDLCSSS